MRPPTDHAARRRASRPVRAALARGDVARLVVIPALTAGMVYDLCIVPARQRTVVDGEIGHVALVEKDASWRPVPPRPGGPSGGVWYGTHGARFRFGLRAVGLQPDIHYIVELDVDGSTYAVANRVATAAGDVALDTALTAFAEGACAGSDRQATRSLVGTHRVKFLLKRNGNPAGAGGGGGSGSAAPRPGGPVCAGNGDGDFTYVLFEEKLAIYDGDR